MLGDLHRSVDGWWKAAAPVHWRERGPPLLLVRGGSGGGGLVAPDGDQVAVRRANDGAGVGEGLDGLGHGALGQARERDQVLLPDWVIGGLDGLEHAGG